VLPFMGWDREPTDAMRAEIGPTRSIGRWRSLDPELLEQVTAVGERTLRHFGYLVKSDVALPTHDPPDLSATRPIHRSDRLEELEHRLEETDHKLEVMTHARARAEEEHGSQLDELAEALEQVGRGLERTQASRTWSWGHRLARLARMLTLRRTGSTSALQQAALAVERAKDALERRDL
jgi:hypothetical protein